MIHSIFYVIIFLLALVLSNVLNQVFPKLALPLIQVILGIILGFLGASHLLDVDPELFLGFIIAPLLFRESEEADVTHIFKHFSTILFLILPLVFLTALGLGYLTHFLLLGIPLAACFALGASLAPTDAIAVGALSKNFKFPKRITSILQGEGLLNDASGIIAFQIAVLALSTGQFSLPNATIDLVESAIGGALIGVILVWIKNVLLRMLNSIAARDVISYLLLEFTIPFAAFLLSEMVHVSGIIAVVVAGVLQANGIKKTTLFDAKVTKIKSTLWDMIVFILNSVVFLFLGIELHQLALPLLNNPLYSNTHLIMMVILLTFALFLLRFISIWIYYFIRILKRHQKFKLYWNDILLLTFAGSKGTVSIATILLIPKLDSVPYSLLIFLVASVTALSFLIGIFVLPLFAAKKTVKVDNIAKISILSDVVSELRLDMQKVKNKEGYAIAIDSYQDRIQKLIIEQESASTSVDFNELQLLIMRLESEGLETAYRNGEISIPTYRLYHRYIRSLGRSISHTFLSSFQFFSLVLFKTTHLLFSQVFHVTFSNQPRKEQRLITREEITTLYFKNTEIILQALESLESVYDTQLIDFLQMQRLRSAELVAHGGYITHVLHKSEPNNYRELMRAYYLERKSIFEYESAGQLSPKEAKLLRQNVNVLEDYSMESNHRTLFFNLLEKRKK
ncbi:cation:proton antiporter [Lactococcus hircilactis]|uniref:cation:proton antiporter n=1 Tax=Lactococcus hircilactis TaxID=1494462 RepID=UPI003FA313FC